MPKTVTVAHGDCISSIAFRFGFYPETIWNDPANAELKNHRTDPNMLVPGDKVVIPDKDPGGVNHASEARHKFRKRGVPALFRIQVFDGEEIRGNQQYSLVIDGKSCQGTTDDRGVIEEWILPDAKSGELVIGPDELKIELLFGKLQPINEIAGVQARLINLGFDCGGVNGQITDTTRSALRTFQERFGIEVTGEFDQPTLIKLQQMHDSTQSFPEETD